MLFADEFRCPVCGLRLRGREQLEEAGLGTAVELGAAQVEDMEAPFAALAAAAEERWLEDEADDSL